MTDILHTEITAIATFQLLRVGWLLVRKRKTEKLKKNREKEEKTGQN